MAELVSDGIVEPIEPLLPPLPRGRPKAVARGSSIGRR